MVGTYADGLYADDGGALPWLHPSEYHAIRDRVSRSQLVRLRKSARAFRYFELHGEVESPTPAMIRGDAIHAGILEPERLLEEYALEPDFGDCRRKEPKAERDAWRDENAGKTIVPKSESVGVEAAIRAVRANDDLSAIFSGSGLTECSALWTEQTDVGIDIPMRCRPDRVNYQTAGSLVLDVKTTLDASASAFWWTVERDALHIQAAVYLRGMTMATGVRHERFGWVVCEVEPPYEVGLYMIDEASLAVGEQEYDDLLEQLAACRANDDYPPITAEPQVGGLSPWVIDRYWKTREAKRA